MFSQEFDRSLLMMLFTDKNKRKNIINFIKYLPNELYVKLYIQLDKYQKYEDNNVDIFDREDFCLYGEYIMGNNIKYSFIIDMVQKSLTITYSSLLNNNLNKHYEITLFDNSRYNNNEFLGKQLLGSFLDCEKNMKTEYEFISTKIGNMIVYSDNGFFKKFKRVNDELENIDLYNYLNEFCYIRTRKIN